MAISATTAITTRTTGFSAITALNTAWAAAATWVMPENACSTWPAWLTAPPAAASRFM